MSRRYSSINSFNFLLIRGLAVNRKPFKTSRHIITSHILFLERNHLTCCRLACNPVQQRTVFRKHIITFCDILILQIYNFMVQISSFRGKLTNKLVTFYTPDVLSSLVQPKRSEYHLNIKTRLENSILWFCCSVSHCLDSQCFCL